jgi:glutathione S-transferase
MVDHSAGDLRVFETGSIMLYLCEYYDTEHKLLPAVSDDLRFLSAWILLRMLDPRAVRCSCMWHAAYISVLTFCCPVQDRKNKTEAINWLMWQMG